MPAPFESDESRRDAAPADPARRALLKVGGAGAFLFAFHVPIDMAAGRASRPSFAPNAFIRIDRSGEVTLIMPQVEMGQGIYTAHSMMLAEELDAAWDSVSVQAAPPDPALYANPVLTVQATGNSNSVRAFWLPLRRAAAASRAMLVAAAARRWRVDPATCTAENGEVIHHPGGRRFSYGALVDAASRETPPKSPSLKSPAEFKLIGRPMRRLDTPDKVNGKAQFGIDVMPPGVKFATLAACPTFGGTVGHVDSSAAQRIPGVRQVIVLDDLVAVVGDHFWAAKQGIAALDITWDEGPNATVDSALIENRLREASERQGLVARNVGDVDKALARATPYEARFQLPFLAHTPMEPMNCTVQVTSDSCEVWVGSQVCARTQQVAARVTGLPLEKVSVHNQLLGGGFGRRLETDATEKAVRIAQKVDGPVKVVYTREEDVQHDLYRPIYYDRIAATLKDGRIDAWHYRVTGSAVVARWLAPAYVGNHHIDFDEVDSAIDLPYDIPNFRVEVVREEPPAVPTGFWRGVGPNNNVFAAECFMDELAAAAGKDPVAFRRAMLDKTPRLKHALDVVAQKAGWGSPLPPRTGRGVCCQISFASFIATVVEAEADTNGEVHLRRVTSAVDTGIAVNPDTVVAQLQGGLIFGLTAALYGEITIEKGRVQQSNFNDYRMLRIDQAPKIDIHLIKSGEPPGGIGETGTTAGPPALRNALYAATGIALRRLPIDRDVLAGRKAPWRS
ncbi:MAG TPA: molybdopterin cofactor-binding domain-containing protein [Steroidobacteraceae bacterium]|jgi:isoquinoline 1-oxidoreductase beta subunit|nr:molybdopterin cofactor-binding domain-containing protein [Steroidobacteraceae bacterium]